MGELILPDRFKHIEKVENFLEGWENVKLAIRPEYRLEKSLEKTRIAIESGLNDAAINYVWNLAMFDIQKKIVAYGIEYFSSAINWDGKPLQTIEDLREVKDYQLITGAFGLGIIPNEAHFFLQQCREIRNNFSTAHFPMGDIDKFETYNFIKNCIKYVLTFDMPARGLQIKDLIESLTLERLESVEEINAIIESQSEKIHGPIIHNLFANFIKQDCDPNLKYNIRQIGPNLWELVSDDIRSNIASKFSSLRDIKGKDAASEALEFLKLVNGVEYIPESFKEIIFKKHSQALLDAHYGWDNFHHEPAYARELASLGQNVPLSSVYIYVKAIMVSFLGNGYGISSGAQQYNVQMISDLSQTGIRTLFKLLENDIDMSRKLSNSSAVNRLYGILDLIKDKTMLPKQKDLFEFINKNKVFKVKGHFESNYWKLAKK
mgnify:FL=1